jgi:hypothetical protein
MHSDVLDPPVLPLPDAALLTALAIPPASHQKVLDRLRQGDITWTDDAAGLVVYVPPSRSTRARARTTPRPYHVTADSCTCRGFFVHGGCYHPFLWTILDAQLHPPVLAVTGATQLTLERTLVVAALEFVRSQAVGELALWFVGNQLDIEFHTAAGSDAQITLVCRGSALESTARGPVTALPALIASCPPSATTVTLHASEAGLQWEVTP